MGAVIFFKKTVQKFFVSELSYTKKGKKRCEDIVFKSKNLFQMAGYKQRQNMYE